MTSITTKGSNNGTGGKGSNKPCITLQWYAGSPVIVPPGDKRDGDNVGLTTGLRLTWFMNEVLFAYAAAGKPVDDAAVISLLKAEFPKRTKVQSVANYCSYFNAGAHGFGNVGQEGSDGKRIGAKIDGKLNPAPSKDPAFHVVRQGAGRGAKAKVALPKLPVIAKPKA